MSRKRKPLWLKLVIWLISTLFSIVVLVGFACGFLYIKYEINVFELGKQIKILNEDVDINKLASNTFSATDMASAKLVTDTNLNGLISYTEQDGYTISPDEVNGNLLGELKFTDKEIGAIIDNIIDISNELGVQVNDNTINLNEYGFKVVQVAFSNITETTTDFNVVVKIDLTKLKNENMNDFPLNWIKKGIPNSLYFSATTTITKGTNAFEYATVGKSLNINNLTAEQTDSIFKTINTFLKLGNSKEFAKIIGDTFINVLIGNESNAGLAYSLKDAGATDFSFETDGTNNYFVIEM